MGSLGGVFMGGSAVEQDDRGEDGRGDGDGNVSRESGVVRM